ASAKLISLVREARATSAKENWGLIVVLGAGLTVSFLTQTLGVERNDDQISWIRCVQEKTQPRDKILNFWSGDAVFRPQASFYWWLCPDLEETLGSAWVEQRMMEALRDPETAAVIWQTNFLKNHPALEDAIRAQYRYSGCGRLWFHELAPRGKNPAL